MQVIEDHFLQVLLHFLHLPENDVSLDSYLPISVAAVEEYVGQDLHR